MLEPVYVRVRDQNYKYVGEISNYINLSATVRFNEVGEWSMDIPAGAPEIKLLLTENNIRGGIVINRGDQRFFSGQIRQHSWRMDASLGYPVLNISGPDDNFALKTRTIWPDPENPNTITPGANYYQVPSTNTESILRDLVAKNLADTAPRTDRRYPGLVQSTNNGKGKVQSGVQLRYDNLLDALQKYAQLAPPDSVVDGEGNVTNPGDQTKALGFRVVQVGQELQFQVYELAVQRHVRFSFDLANLASAEYVTQAPTATFVIVGTGGQQDANGKNIAANIYTRYRAAPYYPARIEAYVDGGSMDGVTDVAAAVDQVALDYLSENTTQLSANIVPIDTERMIYGVHYDLGDYVSVELPFLSFISPIRSVTLTHSGGDGPQVSLGIGTPDGPYSSKTVGTQAKVKKISTALRKLSIVK